MPPSVNMRLFGVTASGVRVTAYELCTASGALRATLIDYGATLISARHAAAPRRFATAGPLTEKR